MYTSEENIAAVRGTVRTLERQVKETREERDRYAALTRDANLWSCDSLADAEAELEELSDMLADERRLLIAMIRADYLGDAAEVARLFGDAR